MAAGKGKKKKDEMVADNLFDLFGAAVQAVHDGEYQQAIDIIETLEASYADELQVLTRAREYKKICTTRLAESAKPVEAQTPEEAFNLGVFHFNNASYDVALKQFSRALDLSRDGKAHIHYAIASVEARRGNSENALQALRLAVESEGKYRHFASHDPDFEYVSGTDSFRSIVDGAGS